jgi:hypothetical protein
MLLFIWLNPFFIITISSGLSGASKQKKQNLNYISFIYYDILRIAIKLNKERGCN